VLPRCRIHRRRRPHVGLARWLTVRRHVCWTGGVASLFICWDGGVVSWFVRWAGEATGHLSSSCPLGRHGVATLLHQSSLFVHRAGGMACRCCLGVQWLGTGRLEW
jgi:hypothetical protein